jgi:hypothetical protein
MELEASLLGSGLADEDGEDPGELHL